jgi:hypothetical protein
MYMDSAPSITKTLITKGGVTSASNAGYRISVTSARKLIYYFQDGTGAVLSKTCTTALSLATWYHVHVNFDRDGNAELFLNNVSDGTLDISSQQGSSTNTTNFAVGNSHDVTGGDCFDGRLDELVYYSKILSSAEITWLYNAGVGRIYSDTTAVGAPSTILTSLVSWWGLGENSGVRYDSHGSNHLSQAFANIIQPAVYGSEILLNGTDFSGAPDNWTATNSTLAAVAGGEAGNCLRVTNSGTNYGYASQSFTTVVGQSYRVRWWHKNGTTTGAIYIGNSAGSGAIYNLSCDDASGAINSATFTATATTTYVSLVNGVNTDTLTTLWDGVSLKEITTPSLLNGGFEDWTSPLTYGTEKLSNTGFETRTGVTGASFAVGDKAHLEDDTDAAYNLGTGDFIINANVLRTSVGTSQIICSKFQNASNYWYLSFNTANCIDFRAVVAGVPIIHMLSNTTICSSTTTKYHIQVVVDRDNAANCKIYINGVSQDFSLSSFAPELVTNGTFTTDLTGWTSVAGGGTVAQDAGTVKITQGGTSQYLKAYQGVTTVSGAKYTYSIKHVANDSVDSAFRCGVGTTAPGNETATYTPELASNGTNTDSTTYSGTVTATGTTTYMVVMNYASAGKIGSWDDISLKQHIVVSATNIDNTGKFFVGQLGDGATAYFNGRVAMLGIGKPADASTGDVTTAIGVVAGSSGLGQYYGEQSSANKTTLAWSAWWDLTEVSGNRVDLASGSSLALAEAFGEIVTNGTFTEADATSPPTGWTNHATYPWDTCDVQSNKMRVVCNGDGAPAWCSVRQQVSITSGRSYTYSYTATIVGANSIIATYVDNTGGLYTTTSKGYQRTLADTTTENTTFTPTASNGYLFFEQANNAAREWTVDNISLKASSIPSHTDETFLSSWTTSQVNGSSVSVTNTAAELHGGAAAVKLVRATANCSEFASIAVTASSAYRLSFWTRGDGTNAGRYYAYDVSNAATITGIVSTGVTSTTYTLVNVDFATPAGCTSVEIAFLSSAANGSTVYFDDVSLKQIVSANAGTWTETVSGTSTINREDTAPYSGTNALRFDTDSSTSHVGVLQTVLTAGKLYSISLYAKVNDATGSPYIRVRSDSSDSSAAAGQMLTSALTTSYAAYSATSRASTTTLMISRGVSAASRSIYLDSVTLAAAEILPAPGIARSLSTDANFAAQLNGSTQYFSYTGTAFNPGTGDFSIGCSFYLDSIPAATGCAIFTGGRAGDGVPYFIGLINPTGKLQFNFNDSTGTHIGSASAGTLSVGNWYTLVANYDRDGNITGYINGASFHTVDISAQNGDCSPGNLFWGSLTVSPSYFVPGRIDNAFYANRLLTADEIAFMHNGGKWRQWAELGVAGTNGSALTSSVIKGFWEFDTSSALGTDSSGNGRTLTNNGTATQGQGINYLAGVVSRWADRSGNTRHFTQATLSKRPAYISGVLNGKPGIYFDGVDDFLSMLTGLDILQNVSGATMFAVIKTGTVSASATHILQVSTNTSSDFTRASILHTGTTKLLSVGGRRLDADSVATVSDSSGLADSTGYVATGLIDYANSNAYIYKNGALVGSSTSFQTDGNTSNTASLAVAVGANGAGATPFGGHILEVVIYNRALSDGERKRVQSYLGRKHSLTIS